MPATVPPSAAPPVPAGTAAGAATLARVRALIETVSVGGLTRLKKPGAWSDVPLRSTSGAPIYVRTPVQIEFVNADPAALAAQLKVVADPAGDAQITVR